MNQHTFNPLADGHPGEYFNHVRQDIMVAVRDNQLTASRVLELGCAAGATGKELKSLLGADLYVGVERSPQAAEKARSNLDRVITADIETIQPAEASLAENEFDLLLAIDVLQHLYDPWETLAKWARCVRPGGRVMICVPNVQNISVVAPLIAGSWDYGAEGLLDASHLRFFTEKSARTLIVGAGLVVEKFQGVPGPMLEMDKVRDADNAINFGSMQIRGLNRQQITLMYIFQFIAIGRKPL